MASSAVDRNWGVTLAIQRTNENWTVRSWFAKAVLGAIIGMVGADEIRADQITPTATGRHTQGQSVDIRRYNVPPEDPGRLLPPLEARRRALLIRVRQNPGDLDAAFAYAQVSARLGDLEGAIATYERLLIRVPNTPRLQLELGALYFRLGAFDTSRSYFQQVLARGDTPDEVRRNISTFMMAMNGNRRKGGFSGRLSYGLRYQSNANAGPNNRLVSLWGQEFTLDDVATGTPDVAAILGVGLNYLQPLPYRGVALQYEFDLAASEFADRSDVSSLDAEFRLGPVFLLDHYGIKGGRFSLSAAVGGGMLGHDPNYTSYGLSMGLQVPKGRKVMNRLNFDYRKEDYRSTDDRPRSDELSGERMRLNGSMLYQFARDWQGIFGLGIERRTAEREDSAYWESSLQLGVNHRFDAPFDLTERPWTLTLAGKFARRVSDGPNPMVSRTERQKGNEIYIQAIQSVPLRDDLALQVYGSYRSIDSNYDIRTFHDAAFGASVVHSF